MPLMCTYYIYYYTYSHLDTVNKRDPPPLVVHLVVLNYARKEQTKSLAATLLYYTIQHTTMYQLQYLCHLTALVYKGKKEICQDCQA